MNIKRCEKQRISHYKNKLHKIYLYKKSIWLLYCTLISTLKQCVQQCAMCDCSKHSLCNSSSIYSRQARSQGSFFVHKFKIDRHIYIYIYISPTFIYVCKHTLTCIYNVYYIYVEEGRVKEVCSVLSVGGEDLFSPERSQFQPSTGKFSVLQFLQIFSFSIEISTVRATDNNLCCGT